MTTTREISYANPFKSYTKAWRVYNLLKGGKSHPLSAITDQVLYLGAGNFADNRRSVGTIIRHVRAAVRPTMWLHESNGSYRLVAKN